MNPIEVEWKKLLNEIVINGELNTKDDSEVKEILGYHTFIKNPLLSNDFLPQTSDGFKKLVSDGYFDIEDYPMSGKSMIEYINSLHDPKNIYIKDSEDSFVYTYPERLLAMETYDRTEKSVTLINQFAVMVKRLKENPGSNRAVATLYNCGLDKDEVDIPCLNFIQATIRNNKLVLSIMFRSNDIYGAWPSNMFLITYIGLCLCEELKGQYPSLSFKGIDYHVSSAHIYTTDFQALEKIKL